MLGFPGSLFAWIITLEVLEGWFLHQERIVEAKFAVVPLFFGVFELLRWMSKVPSTLKNIRWNASRGAGQEPIALKILATGHIDMIDASSFLRGCGFTQKYITEYSAILQQNQIHSTIAIYNLRPSGLERLGIQTPHTLMMIVLAHYQLLNIFNRRFVHPRGSLYKIK